VSWAVTTTGLAPFAARASAAAAVAATHADDVDRAGRFPDEAVGEMRAQRLLSALVPVDRGGDGISYTELTALVTDLGARCASTAMIFAMHQIQVACLVRHGFGDALEEIVDDVVREQLLLASATTEAGIGGDVRSSGCAVQARDDGGWTLQKDAPVISYGAYADAVLATARRTPDSPPGDQVLAVCRRPGLELTPTSVWDTLGFRGTCSPGFTLRASGEAGLLLAVPYADISAETMLPVSHLLWSGVWLGIASAAYSKARKFVQEQARRKPGTTPPGALRLAELTVVFQQMRAMVEVAARDYDERISGTASTGTFRSAITANTLKVATSELVVEIVSRALLICGISGYREDSSYRMGRLLRDAHGAAAMVGNDRILTNTAHLLLADRG
jgi:acyl-CoA dehydrogenase